MTNLLTLGNEKFNTGDLVRVHQTVKEADKEKDQIFEGRIIAIKGRAPNTNFTVRKIGADNIGVEKIFPLFSPAIKKIELKKSFPSKRAKLYTLRKSSV